jgi:NAD:arginine ADP-ribosyltransferase./Phage Mu protein F like protein.
MATVNEAIRDLEIRHQVNVQRLSSATLRKLIPLLDKADGEIVAKLLSRGATLEGSFTSVRLQKLLDAIRDINHAAHVAAGKVLTRELLAIAGYEAGFQQRLIGSALPIAWDFVSPSAEMLKAAVTARPFQGRLLKEWVSELDQAKGRRLRDAIRLGVIQGETVDQIVRRVRGTKALNYADGVMSIGRRGAEAMVRTAVAHTTTAARDELYAANADLIAAEQWVSTLDTRTCPHCMGLDGQKLAVGKGTRTPAHIACRCIRVPITRSWRELGFDIDDLPAGTRASMNGQVSATETYDSWLRKQPAAVQDEALGPSRGALFRSGGLSVDRFTNRAGDELSLEQLKAKEDAAFGRAGLNNPIKSPPGAPRDAIAAFLDDVEAQRDLLRAEMPDYDHHRRVVESVIAANRWKAQTEPVMGVRHYTGAAYEGWNRRLREGQGTLTDRKMTALTAKGVDQMPPHKGEIWRAPMRNAQGGDRLWNEAVIGQPLGLKEQFQSFTASREVAVSWSSSSNLVVYAKSTPRGAIIDKVSQHPSEREVLLPPGLRYKVIEKRVEDGIRVIVVEIENGN